MNTTPTPAVGDRVLHIRFGTVGTVVALLLQGDGWHAAVDWDDGSESTAPVHSLTPSTATDLDRLEAHVTDKVRAQIKADERRAHRRRDVVRGSLAAVALVIILGGHAIGWW
jgi:hypothetical protein